MSGGFDPLRPSELRRALEAAGLRPDRRYSQNFLVDRNVVHRIIAAAAIEPGDGVLEVGPGAGALTPSLADAAATVVAIEIDRRLAPVLERAVGSRGNVRLVYDDAVKVDWTSLRDAGRPWRFVANLPYQATAPLLIKAFRSEPPFERLVVMVQKEVAERMRAVPHEPAYGALSVLTSYYARVESAFDVPPGCFWPRPQVRSTVVAMTAVRPDSPAGAPPPALLFKVVRAVFGRRRKTLRNALSDDPHLRLSRDEAAVAMAAAGLDPGMRGETLSLEQFVRLAAAVQAVAPQTAADSALSPGSVEGSI